MKEHHKVTGQDVEDYDQLERILNKFLALPAEKKEIVLKEADKILNEK